MANLICFLSIDLSLEQMQPLQARLKHQHRRRLPPDSRFLTGWVGEFLGVFRDGDIADLSDNTKILNRNSPPGAFPAARPDPIQYCLPGGLFAGGFDPLEIFVQRRGDFCIERRTIRFTARPLLKRSMMPTNFGLDNVDNCIRVCTHIL